MPVDERSAGMVIMFVVALIILSIGALITLELRELGLDTVTRSSNDSVSGSNTTLTQLAFPRILNTTVTVYDNRSTIVPKKNSTSTLWEMLPDDSIFGRIRISWGNSTTFNVSYNYAWDVETAQVNVSDDGLDALQTTTAISTPLGITIFAAIILILIGGIIILVAKRM